MNESVQDRGSVIALVVVLCLGAGIACVALVDYLGTALRSGQAYESRLERSAAVDAALTVAVDAVAADPGSCTSGLPDVTTNGRRVIVFCSRTTAGETETLQVTARIASESSPLEGVATVEIPNASGVPCRRDCNVIVESWTVGTP